MTSRTLAMAEIIMEFFNGLHIDQILKFEPKNARNALWLLTYFRLVRVENNKVVLTSYGKRYIDLPYSNK